MAKLKLGTIESDKPVRLAITLPAAVHRDLVAYAQALAHETGQDALNQKNSSTICWHVSWRLIAASPRLEGCLLDQPLAHAKSDEG